MAIRIPRFDKFSGDSRVYEWDYSKMIELPGDPLVSATVNQLNVVSPDTVPLVIGSPSVSGVDKIHVRLGGGTPGACYTVECAATTTSGSVLVWAIELEIFDEATICVT